VTGVAFTGFLFNIENSRNITIRNFHKVEKYFYALSAKQSTDIHVLDNNFSYNKKDTSGWISIYTGVVKHWVAVSCSTAVPIQRFRAT
jgi:hypothetical protein